MIIRGKINDTRDGAVAESHGSAVDAALQYAKTFCGFPCESPSRQHLAVLREEVKRLRHVQDVTADTLRKLAQSKCEWERVANILANAATFSVENPTWHPVATGIEYALTEWAKLNKPNDKLTGLSPVK